MATAFFMLFIAFPPTFDALAALAVKLGLACDEDTENKQGKKPIENESIAEMFVLST